MDMGGDMFVGVIVASIVMIVVMVAAAVVAAIGRARHRDRLAALAANRGWTYTPSNRSLPSTWSPGRFGRRLPFTSGTASDIMTGRHRGHRFTAFTAITTRTSTDTDGHSSTDRTYFGVVVLQLPAPLPNVAVEREGFGARIAKFFGGEDIEIGSPAFDSAFRVRSDDPEFVRTLLTPDLVAWLMARNRSAGPLIIMGGDLMTWHKGSLDHKTLPTTLTGLATFASRISDDVWGMWGTAR
ncbi:MAG: DUF3137 domain-containing protein [Micrococcales bacterium]|nr:DUF3137 domain-containing protein [Micrococcales bacterium]